MGINSLSSKVIKAILPFFLILSLSSLACDGSAATATPPTAVPTAMDLTIEQYDQEAIDLYLNKYVIEDLPIDLSGDLTNLNVALGDPASTEPLPAADVYVPVMQMTPDVYAYITGTIQSLTQAPLVQVEQFASLGFDRWYKDTLMHSTNHLRMLGMNQYDVRSTTTFIHQIIQGGLTGQGQVVYRPAVGAYSEAYGFFTQINGKTWFMLIDAKTGAPITTWMTGLAKQGNPSTYSEARAAAEMTKILLRGSYQIPNSQIPQHIRDAWGTQPSAVRILWWALSYQMRVETAKAGAAITAYTIEAWNTFSGILTQIGQIKLTPVFLIVIQDDCGNWVVPETIYTTPACGMQ